MRLPVGEKVGDDAQFLIPDEIALLLDKIPERFKVLVQSLVMTGTRLGEATAVTTDGLDLLSTPATVRINKEWKLDGNNAYYVGSTKTGAGRGTFSLPLALVELLSPLVAGRQGVRWSSPHGRVVRSGTALFGRRPGYPA